MPANVPRGLRRRPEQNGAPGTPRTRSFPVRRTQLVRIAVWVAVAAGPLALVVSCARPDVVVRTRPAPVTQTDAAKAPVTDPGGYAELVLDVWLRAGRGEETAAAKQLRAVAPRVQPPAWGKHAPSAERLTAVRSLHQGSNAWSVTVAVRFKGSDGRSEKAADAPRYFALPLLVKDAGTAPGTAQGFTVAAAPMEVSAPSTLDLDPQYGAEVPARSPLARTAGEFLAAYLGAAEGADRYLAPGVSIPALTVAPFETVRVDEVRTDQQMDGKPGTDGTTARLQVQASASDADGGQWPLSYGLKLVARDGRWEVLALQSGLEDVGKDGKARAKRSSSASATSAGLSPTGMRHLTTATALEAQR
ncbi:conjugal transfer protein [Streptomyces sp. NPDC018584]|uniref:conjugal transfer protein n=1 Tax=unclassified Streptomyces TaxID=2593676 RepID=UPI0037A48640